LLWASARTRRRWTRILGHPEKKKKKKGEAAIPPDFGLTGASYGIAIGVGPSL